jgi:deoxycytidine triphosphate deaminase
MTVLSTTTLRERIYGVDGGSGDIFVTPILEASQVAHSAVDIRLGRHFIVTRSNRLPAFDVKQMTAEDDVARYQEKMFRDFGDSLALQPGTCVLGSVLEYISLPDDVYVEVLTRSSWGRLAITIATAICVHPGYSGCLTLELVNMGESAVLLYPGTKIGQLVFYQLDQADKDARATGKYAAPTVPQFPKIHRESAELERLGVLGRQMRG